MRYKTILFDLDGTLLDTNELIIQSFVHTLGKFYPQRSFGKDDIIPHMGMTLRGMFDQFDEQLLAEQREEMVAVYRAFNHKMHDEMVQSFPFVEEVLVQLADHGLNMGIVTTKQRKTAEMGLHITNIAQYMHTIVGIDDVQEPKPHPEPVLKAMALMGAVPDLTLMIGDNVSDIQSAHRAGIHSAGVCWSLKGAEHLRSSSPTYMLESMQDLFPIIGIAE